MKTPLECIRTDANSLVRDERELLLAALDYDLRGGFTVEEGEMDAAWAAEISGRFSDVQQGKVGLVSTESVDAALDAVFASYGIGRSQRFA